MPLILVAVLLLTIDENDLTKMQRIEQPPFLLYYDTSRKFAERLLTSATEAEHDIEETTGLTIPENITIAVLSNKRIYQKFVKRRGGEVFSVGVAFTERSLIVVDASTEHAVFQPASAVLRHELFHIALADSIRKKRLKRVPLWFNEGVAQLFERRRLNNLERQDLATLARSGGIPPFDEFSTKYPESEHMRRIFYLASADFIRYITKDDPKRLLPFFKRLQDSNFDEAFKSVFGDSIETLQLLWQQSLAKEYSFWSQVLQRMGVYLVFSTLIIILVVVHFIRRRRGLRRLDELEP